MPTAPLSLLQLWMIQRPQLVNTAARILGCPSRAEDVVQDAWFRLLSAPAPGQPNDNLSGYLTRIVRNLAIDHYRKRSAEARYLASEEDAEQVLTRVGAPDVTFVQRHTLAEVDQALARLPARTRYAFEMHRVQGVQQKVIARELGVSATLVNFMVRDATHYCLRAVGRAG